jgi:molybdopterin/thiamine biosynthesis adenylyltransferase
VAVAEFVVLEDIVAVLDTNPEELGVGDDDCVLDGLDVPDTVPDLRGVCVIGGLLEVDMLTVEVLD